MLLLSCMLLHKGDQGHRIWESSVPNQAKELEGMEGSVVPALVGLGLRGLTQSTSSHGSIILTSSGQVACWQGMACWAAKH